MDVAIVGAGVVGCAVASALARRGRSVVVLERGAREATGVTARNSGVVHSGLYYPPGSLKADTCLRGQALLYAWAAAHDVPHARVGKLVVARDDAQLAALHALHANAVACGAADLEIVDDVARREPALPTCRAALWCPHTGIVDPHALTRSLRVDAENHGAVFAVRGALRGATATPDGFELDSERGALAVAAVVNAAGLDADLVAAMFGAAAPRIHACRGDYFRLHTPVRYRHLVYPVRAAGSPGLGVHLTLDLAGGVRLGPDVEYVAARDEFGPAEHKHPAFHAAAEALLGPLAPDRLRYDGCGIRPKLRAPGEPAERDFAVFMDPPGCVHLVGIESPGLTAALALAERVAAML